MRKVITAVSLALMATSFGAFAKDWKEVRFGVDASYAPFESKAPNGQLVGFDIDLGNEICARMKAKCVWVENDFDGMIRH
jgi:ABC-type amino acid transport substrate-binding protein